jgi:hypothetical protein
MFLGKIKQAEKLLQQNIKNVQDLFNSVLNEAFSQGTEKQSLDMICKKILAGGDKPRIFSEIKTEEISIPIYANSVKTRAYTVLLIRLLF